MRSSRVFSAVDSHTEGMPTRVITSGIPTLPGDTMLARKQHLETELDHLRTLLMCEPRGHGAMSGAILQPATRPDADWGVVFIEVSGCLPMCGHGLIGTVTVLVETGMVEVTEPVTTVRMDTPAGLVEANVDVSDGRARAVTMRNVPSFLLEADATVQAGDGIGEVAFDMAYGGNFYAIVKAAALGIELDTANAPALIRAGLSIMAAINEQARPVHPETPEIGGCHHVQIVAPGDNGTHARNAVVIHPGWIDRSPCGTGTSARMAQLHHRGQLGLHQPFVNSSLIGTRFTGSLVDETTVAGRKAVVPNVTGSAWITGMGQYLLDPTDPFPAGFQIPAV